MKDVTPMINSNPRPMSLDRYSAAVEAAIDRKLETAEQCQDLAKQLETLERNLSPADQPRPEALPMDALPASIMMDPTMHHRISLAVDMARSLANGASMSLNRRRIFKKNLAYISDRLQATQ